MRNNTELHLEKFNNLASIISCLPTEVDNALNIKANELVFYRAIGFFLMWISWGSYSVGNVKEQEKFASYRGTCTDGSYHQLYRTYVDVNYPVE